ncbi:Retrovirus-related Pol polyprotein from transposon TNT 1-94 [Cucumis melo var. makuwa]|uniref:Retrovirus-related Pol polyprotein from transposon TNT 1-94 n=1 Tax=Cucumis melo var. makuwa TaxID=1194695 RepID=A0A5D3BL83_CUCMM|nr:Retrovirus-related Pol polyprotein from transposon TNT 1-94 [Cucumis melo var. makuwa]
MKVSEWWCQNLVIDRSRIVNVPKYSSFLSLSVNKVSNRGSSNHTPQGCRNNLSYGNCGNNGGQSRGRGRSRGPFCPTCEVCGKIGHTIDICYNRFNKKFVPNSGKNSNKGTTNNFRNNNDKLSTAFVTSHPANPFNVTRENSVDANWYANNRAMNHMTADYTNLANPVEYGGKVQVTIGNGDKLKITSIGNSTLMNGGYMLSLDNVLYVPAIAKNLVSVSKRARDKHVFVEFHDDYCLVKDNGTRQTILKGMLKDDLYHLEEAVVKLAAKGKRNTNDSKKNPTLISSPLPSLTSLPSSPSDPSLSDTRPSVLPPKNSHPMITHKKAGIFKPKVWLSSVRTDWTFTEPTRVFEALKTP